MGISKEVFLHSLEGLLRWDAFVEVGTGLFVVALVVEGSAKLESCYTIFIWSFLLQSFLQIQIRAIEFLNLHVTNGFIIQELIE